MSSPSPAKPGDPGDPGDVVVAVAAVAAGPAAIGEVVAAGERTSGLLGRRVLVGSIDPCGECDVCRRGGAPVCPQARVRDAIADRVVAAARWVVPLGDGLELSSPQAAVVAGEAALAYTLYARTGVSPRDPVVVTGASPTARFLVEILLAKGVTPTVVVDPEHEAWHSWLAGRGASVVGTDGDTRALVAQAIAAQGIGAKPWRVIAASSATAALAIELAGPRATVTLLAPAAAAGDVATRELTVIGVSRAHPDLVVEVAAMCAKGEIDLAGGVVDRDPPDPRNAVMQAIVALR